MEVVLNNILLQYYFLEGYYSALGIPPFNVLLVSETSDHL